MPMGSSGPAPCRVTVCRDCCCGSPKVTGIDHAGQLERLRQAAPVRVSRCLDACEQANIVVVQPSAAGRAKGAAATDDIAAWVRAGGPGLADPPAVLELYSIRPPRRPAAGSSREVMS